MTNGYLFKRILKQLHGAKILIFFAVSIKLYHCRYNCQAVFVGAMGPPLAESFLRQRQIASISSDAR